MKYPIPSLLSGFMKTAARSVSCRLARREDGSAILEFAIALPLLVVFIVGIYDFSAAFDQKQKIEQAAQEGAIVAAAQPTSDITTTGSPDPPSLQPVVAAVFNSLAGSGVLDNVDVGRCKISRATATQTAGTLTWTYSINGCSNYPRDTNPGCMGQSSDRLWIGINRGWVPTGATTPTPVGTTVTVSYNYVWRFNSVIQVLLPSASYSPKTCITETAAVHNQT